MYIKLVKGGVSLSAEFHMKSSVESQKGIIAVQRCSLENQKGRYHCAKSLAIASFWFSTEHLWTAVMPFWLSTDEICNDVYYVKKCVENWFLH